MSRTCCVSMSNYTRSYPYTRPTRPSTLRIVHALHNISTHRGHHWSNSARTQSQIDSDAREGEAARAPRRERTAWRARAPGRGYFGTTCPEHRFVDPARNSVAIFGASPCG
ncbi:hypothetical protein COCMIDRAFT_95289 [Bipolaris oryzae ATCC 44560]|uniref:Uncharacterized protein n=1 Tax=Bipolaris oryzae ATCC 44560 TaxID=930090 RepID=W6Z6B2_COCMI|nr:uncharacterized protein COCMIDRAFT_95289 [Bipolaris oryzae ATCC 44560]EUC45535.1 hypothetical protein COCMIDRAFT_95289 [Bipolaris oryzae ATCC 44560]